VSVERKGVFEGSFRRGRESGWAKYRMRERLFAGRADEDAALVIAATVCIDQMSRG
jgi:hypothetical protein